jgi:hypothetical protein
MMFEAESIEGAIAAAVPSVKLVAELAGAANREASASASPLAGGHHGLTAVESSGLLTAVVVATAAPTHGVRVERRPCVMPRANARRSWLQPGYAPCEAADVKEIVRCA